LKISPCEKSFKKKSARSNLSTVELFSSFPAFQLLKNTFVFFFKAVQKIKKKVRNFQNETNLRITHHLRDFKKSI